MLLVVDVIPSTRSNEGAQDSEPNIAVNPANTSEIGITAFTPPEAGDTDGGIYYSTDGGFSWDFRKVVPGADPAGTGLAFQDITVRFGTSSNELYAAALRGDNANLNVDRTSDLTLGTELEILPDVVADQDQPFIQAATSPAGANAGKDLLFIGLNNTAAGVTAGAAVHVCPDALAAPPTFTAVPIEVRATSGQDGPSIRPAIHSSGTVYAAFFGWRTKDAANNVTADVVVVRDDAWGTGNFTALTDPGDGKNGVRVAAGVNFVFLALLGQERTGSDLSLAVDPANNQRVWIAWGDGQGSPNTLHVRQSTDGGQTWGADLLMVSPATNPSIAINGAGVVGFLYQQVTGTDPNKKWETHFQRSADGATWTDLVLARTPADKPPVANQPYLGDYIHMLAIGEDFYGAFCANNTPDPGNFPSGIQFVRKVDLAAHKLLNTDSTENPNISIDPFFFKVGRPEVQGINPTNGAAGTSVVITGKGFTGVTGVGFGATGSTSVTPDPDRIKADTTITAVAPAGTGTVDITVVTPGGTSVVIPADQFTYSDGGAGGAPTVSQVSPNSGQAAGGDRITITGTNLSGATNVNFGADAADPTTFAPGGDASGGDPNTTLALNSPATTQTPPATVDVTVTTAAGTSTIAPSDQFTYQAGAAAAPTITGINPTQGALAGGDTVVITGTGFTGFTAVGFDGTNAPNANLDSDTQLTVTTPAGNAAGDVQVTVVTPAGTSNAVTFTYQAGAAAAPTITGINPTQGALAGGDTVVITGTGFTGFTAVGFDGTNAANANLDSDTQLTVTTPAGNAAGDVQVTVVTPAGTSNAVTFTYTDGGMAVGPRRADEATVTVAGRGYTVTITLPPSDRR